MKAMLLAFILLAGCSIVPVENGTVVTAGNTAVVIVDPATSKIYYVRSGNQELSGVTITKNDDGTITVTVGGQGSDSDAVKTLVGTLPDAVAAGVKAAMGGL